MKIAVAMSGGIDSSYAAYKLKQNYKNVEGFTFKVDNYFDTEKAKYVAAVLGIKHKIIDISKEFKEKVIQYFIKSYLNGYTPNPCVICNKYIKSEIFLEKINQLYDFDYLATGHYTKKEKLNSNIVLKEHENTLKSQTYFLALIKEKMLKKLLFPLQDIEKEDVQNKMISMFSVIFKKSRESFEICFIKNKKYYNFIRESIKEKSRKGVFMNSSGKVLGKHTGFYKYTIGQRRGLRISANKKLYVYKIDPQKNIVYVGEESMLYKDYLYSKNINWFYKPSKNEKMFIRTRYNGKLVKIKKITRIKDLFKIKLTESLKAITPGQLAAFYLGNYLIGGAIIERY